MFNLHPHGLQSTMGSSVHWILQARILEWVAISYSRGSPWTQGPNPEIHSVSLSSSAFVGGLFTSSVTWEAHTVSYWVSNTFFY